MFIFEVFIFKLILSIVYIIAIFGGEQSMLPEATITDVEQLNYAAEDEAIIARPRPRLTQIYDLPQLYSAIATIAVRSIFMV